MEELTKKLVLIANTKNLDKDKKSKVASLIIKKKKTIKPLLIQAINGLSIPNSPTSIDTGVW